MDGTASPQGGFPPKAERVAPAAWINASNSKETASPVLLSLAPKKPGERRVKVFGQHEALVILKGMVAEFLRNHRDDKRVKSCLRRGALALQSCFRQHKALMPLIDIVAAIRGVTGDPDKRVFALLGRYGQGKSTLLAQLKYRIEKTSPAAPRRRRFRVREFDVASCTPDSLSYEFSRLIDDWYLRDRLLLVAVILALLSVVAASLNQSWPARFNALFSGAPAAGVLAAAGVIGLWSFVGPLLRALFQEERQVQRRLGRAWNVASWTQVRRLLQDVLYGPPDLLIVDNLDRAVAEQQRAFLLALRRNYADLPAAVVVAFDETPLSLSDPNPDTPQELLSKAFITSVRLYPMTKDDVKAIVIGILHDLRADDPEANRYPLCHLQYAQVTGDLARILFFHRPEFAVHRHIWPCGPGASA
jgi:hypothetical protein